LLATFETEALSNERKQMVDLFENVDEARTAVRSFIASALRLPNEKALRRRKELK
jgi:hypothetical protein